MKILCLHGYGTSGDIFEEQLSSIIAALGPHHEFVFIDGEVPVNRSELAGFIAGKNLCFYDGCYASEQVPAHELLATAIAAEDPPFDGVMGYSQGGSFAISYMIQQMIEDPEAPLPFKFGVFFSPGFCIPTDQNYNNDTIMRFLRHFTPADAKALQATMQSQKVLRKPEQYDAYAKCSPEEKALFDEIMAEVHAMFGTRDVFHIEERNEGLDRMHEDYQFGKSDFPKFFNPIYTPQRLPIPTVHISGVQDDAAPRHLAKVARGLCEQDKVIVLELPGVHEIPHRRPDVERVAKAIEKAHYLSQMTPTLVKA